MALRGVVGAAIPPPPTTLILAAIPPPLPPVPTSTARRTDLSATRAASLALDGSRADCAASRRESARRRLRGARGGGFVLGGSCGGAPLPDDGRMSEGAVLRDARESAANRLSIASSASYVRRRAVVTRWWRASTCSQRHKLSVPSCIIRLVYRR
jgi:hypothetical protein